MITKEKILETIIQSKGEIGKTYKVKRIGLFGSFIKGTQKKNSDVDILVDFRNDADLFDLSGLALFLERKLNRKVDIVSRMALRKELRNNILKEVAYL